MDFARTLGQTVRDKQARITQLQAEVGRLREALQIAEWGTESLCAGCWDGSTNEEGYPFGVDPVHASDCPIGRALSSS